MSAAGHQRRCTRSTPRLSMRWILLVLACSCWHGFGITSPVSAQQSTMNMTTPLVTSTVVVTTPVNCHSCPSLNYCHERRECRPCSDCPPGMGYTPNSCRLFADSQCASCTEGVSYSPVADRQLCRTCRPQFVVTCPKGSYIRHCTLTRDTSCGSCNESPADFIDKCNQCLTCNTTSVCLELDGCVPIPATTPSLTTIGPNSSPSRISSPTAQVGLSMTSSAVSIPPPSEGSSDLSTTIAVVAVLVGMLGGISLLLPVIIVVRRKRKKTPERERPSVPQSSVHSSSAPLSVQPSIQTPEPSSSTSLSSSSSSSSSPQPSMQSRQPSLPSVQPLAVHPPLPQYPPLPQHQLANGTEVYPTTLESPLPVVVPRHVDVMPATGQVAEQASPIHTGPPTLSSSVTCQDAEFGRYAPLRPDDSRDNVQLAVHGSAVDVPNLQVRLDSEQQSAEQTASGVVLAVQPTPSPAPTPTSTAPNDGLGSPGIQQPSSATDVMASTSGASLDETNSGQPVSRPTSQSSADLTSQNIVVASTSKAPRNHRRGPASDDAASSTSRSLIQRYTDAAAAGQPKHVNMSADDSSKPKSSGRAAAAPGAAGGDPYEAKKHGHRVAMPGAGAKQTSGDEHSGALAPVDSIDFPSDSDHDFNHRSAEQPQHQQDRRGHSVDASEGCRLQPDCAYNGTNGALGVLQQGADHGRNLNRRADTQDHLMSSGQLASGNVMHSVQLCDQSASITAGIDTHPPSPTESDTEPEGAGQSATASALLFADQTDDDDVASQRGNTEGSQQTPDAEVSCHGAKEGSQQTTAAEKSSDDDDDNDDDDDDNDDDGAEYLSCNAEQRQATRPIMETGV